MTYFGNCHNTRPIYLTLTVIGWIKKSLRYNKYSKHPSIKET